MNWTFSIADIRIPSRMSRIRTPMPLYQIVKNGTSSSPAEACIKMGPRKISICSLSHRKLVSTNKPVAFRSVHTGIEPPFLLRFLSTLWPILQLIAHHIQDKLAVSFDSSSIGLISYKWFLTIDAKYSSVKAYNKEKSIF